MTLFALYIARLIMGFLMIYYRKKLNLGSSLKQGFIVQWIALILLIMIRVVLAIDYYDNTWITVVLELCDFVYECVICASHAYIHIKLVQAVYILPKEFQRNLEYARYPASIVLVAVFCVAILLLNVASDYFTVSILSIVVISMNIMVVFAFCSWQQITALCSSQALKQAILCIDSEVTKRTTNSDA